MSSKEKSKTKKSKQDGKQKNEKKEANEGWEVFCDFHEITHTVIKETTVTIIRQDNKKMVRENQQTFIFPVPTAFLLTCGCIF